MSADLSQFNPEVSIPRLAVKLQGGIGNQVFQWCFGEAMAAGSGLNVSYLVDAFATDPYGRKNIINSLFPASSLHVQSDVATGQSRLLGESMLNGSILTPLGLHKMLRSQQVDVCILDGYWQDNAYVNVDCLKRLRAAMSTLAASSESTRFAHCAQQLAQCQMPVAMHVRRHDYRHHGICRESYYIDCARWFCQQNPNASVLVFSDEPNYTGHFLRAAGIAHQLIYSGDDLLDLYLMSRCRMHIIANSSFSWWGARLALSERTIYPLPWSQVQAPSNNMFPPEWHGLDDAVTFGTDQVSFTAALYSLASDRSIPAPI